MVITTTTGIDGTTIIAIIAKTATCAWSPTDVTATQLGNGATCARSLIGSDKSHYRYKVSTYSNNAHHQRFRERIYQSFSLQQYRLSSVCPTPLEAGSSAH